MLRSRNLLCTCFLYIFGIGDFFRVDNQRRFSGNFPGDSFAAYFFFKFSPISQFSRFSRYLIFPISDFLDFFRFFWFFPDFRFFQIFLIFLIFPDFLDFRFLPPFLLSAQRPVLSRVCPYNSLLFDVPGRCVSILSIHLPCNLLWVEWGSNRDRLCSNRSPWSLYHAVGMCLLQNINQTREKFSSNVLFCLMNSHSLTKGKHISIHFCH